MAQYEEPQVVTTEAEKQELVNSLTGDLQSSVKEAISDLISQSKDVVALGNFDSGSTEKTNIPAQSVDHESVAAKSAHFEDLSLGQSTTTFVANQVSGNVTDTSTKPLNAFVNDSSNLNVNVQNNSDNNLNFFGNNNDVSVETGNGNDDMSVSGAFTGQFKTGSGNLNLTLDAEAQQNAEISVDAGDGFDMLTFNGHVKHEFGFSNGQFTIHSGNITLDNVEVVVTDMNGDGQTNADDHLTVLATNNQESLAARLYMVTLGREAIDGGDGILSPNGDALDGFKFWTESFNGSAEQMVRAFMACEEVATKYQGMDDTHYVNQLFNNLGVSDITAANNYIEQLNSGAMDREQVALDLATSQTTTAALGDQGKQYLIDSDDVNFSA